MEGLVEKRKEGEERKILICNIIFVLDLLPW